MRLDSTSNVQYMCQRKRVDHESMTMEPKIEDLCLLIGLGGGGGGGGDNDDYDDYDYHIC